MTRYMVDSTNPAAIPPSAVMVAGYVNGAESQWPAAAWSRFPHSVHVRIDVIGDAWADASVVDVEKGDVTVDHAAAWVKARNAFVTSHGWPADATVYTSRSNWAAVQAACAGLNVRYWIADWTGAPHALQGAVAVQYADPGTHSGGQFDLSLVTDDSWHPSPAPSWLTQARADVKALADLLASVTA